MISYRIWQGMRILYTRYTILMIFEQIWGFFLTFHVSDISLCHTWSHAVVKCKQSTAASFDGAVAALQDDVDVTTWMILDFILICDCEWCNVMFISGNAGAWRVCIFHVKWFINWQSRKKTYNPVTPWTFWDSKLQNYHNILDILEMGTLSTCMTSILRLLLKAQWNVDNCFIKKYGILLWFNTCFLSSMKTS